MSSDLRPRALLLATVLVALVVRVAALGQKPFWRDEAWVAVLASEPLTHVFEGPRTAVPVGFLALIKASATLPSLPPEVGLRLVPLAAGLLALPALVALGRGLGAPPTTCLAALWLAGGLPVLVYYSRELKHYALDLLLGALLPWLVLAVTGRGHGSRWSGLALGLLAIVLLGPWLSFAYVLVAATAFAWGAWAVIRAPADTRRRVGPPLAAASTLAAVSFLTAYALVLRAQAASPTLRMSWEGEMGPGPGWLAERWVQALGSYSLTQAGSLFPGVLAPAAALLVLGAAAWPASGRAALLALVGGEALLASAAAAFGLYPVTQARVLLFAAPPLVLLAAHGLVRACEPLGRVLPRRAGAWGGVAVAVAGALFWSTTALAHRYGTYRNDPKRYFLYDVIHDVEPLIARAAELAAPAEPVMVSRYAGEPFRYYARGRLPQAFVCTRLNCRDEGPPLGRFLAGVRGRGYMILLEEEDRPLRRRTVAAAGLSVELVSASRGARLWRLERRPAAGVVVRPGRR